MSEKDYPPLPIPGGQITLGYGAIDTPFFTADQMRAYIDADRAQRKPLTLEQIEQATGGKRDDPLFHIAVAFVRDTEAAHGIKEQP